MTRLCLCTHGPEYHRSLGRGRCIVTTRPGYECACRRFTDSAADTGLPVDDGVRFMAGLMVGVVGGVLIWAVVLGLLAWYL